MGRKNYKIGGKSGLEMTRTKVLKTLISDQFSSSVKKNVEINPKLFE